MFSPPPLAWVGTRLTLFSLPAVLLSSPGDFFRGFPAWTMLPVGPTQRPLTSYIYLSIALSIIYLLLYLFIYLSINLSMSVAFVNFAISKVRIFNWTVRSSICLFQWMARQQSFRFHKLSWIKSGGAVCRLLWLLAAFSRRSGGLRCIRNRKLVSMFLMFWVDNFLLFLDGF